MIRSLTLFLATIATANAACDNACSGHGTCQVDDVCQCHDNWGVGLSLDTGDCSDRICPFEISWVDSPNVDGDFHSYSECSGKGICDRTTGECECFDGYEGKGCKRSSCPNDCSGHGTCEYIEDLPFGVVWAIPDGTQEQLEEYPGKVDYYGWDKGKTRGCVCDSQYADSDCSKRMCPHGTDVLDTRENLLNQEKYQIQDVVFIFDHENYVLDESQTFALKFTSRLNESFVTVPVKFKYKANIADFIIDVRLALLTLPHQVIDDCQVHAYVSMGSGNTIDQNLTLQVTFTGDAVQGPQNLLQVIDYECGAGCTPKTTGLHQLNTHIHATWGSGISEKVMSDFNSYECGRRGKCDYETGLCACFEGYSGENCNTQNALV